jgi:3-oxoacyl-[acyl-carrier protein] reductase
LTVPLALTFPGKGGVFVAGGDGVVGSAVVRTFTRAGVPVAFTYLANAARAKELAKEASALGAPATAYALDLGDSRATRSLLVSAARKLRGFHTVIYTAGPTLQFAPVRELPPEDAERFLLGDAMCCYRLFHHAIPLLAGGGGGALIACSSMATMRVVDNDALSAMPKAAIEALVRQVAAEEAARKIRCNAVALGWIGGWASSFEEAFAVAESMPTDTRDRVLAMLRQMVASIRMRRPGRPQEAANLIAYLASEQASYITGRTVQADGGASL